MAPVGLRIPRLKLACRYFLSFLSNYCIHWIQTFHNCSISIKNIRLSKKSNSEFIKGLVMARFRLRVCMQEDIF